MKLAMHSAVVHSRIPALRKMGKSGLDMPLEGVVVRGIAFKKQSFECAQVITNRSQYMIDEWSKH